MIKISNAGQDIQSTDYWDTEHAAVGLCFLSGNAGALRLLVPEAAEGLLSEMRTGKYAYIEPSIRDPRCWDLVFDDGTDSPFSLSLDKRQTDRALTAGKCPLAIWTQRGKVFELQCEVRLPS